MEKQIRILITGKPGCGKTTLVKHLGHYLRQNRYTLRGFYTEEIREEGSRVGFIIKTWDGMEALLAHKNAESPYGVGKYRVLLENIDNIAVPAMKPQSKDDIIIVDEVGKMECLSPIFCKQVLSLMEASNLLVMTIPLRGGKLVEKIRSMPGARIFVIDRHDRDRVREELAQTITACLKKTGK